MIEALSVTRRPSGTLPGYWAVTWLENRVAYSYVGPARLSFIQEDGAEPSADVSVTLGETMPGLFELSFPHALPAAQAAVWVRVRLPDGEERSGQVRYLAPSSLTFRADRSGQE
jgi:hypothetical protein